MKQPADVPDEAVDAEIERLRLTVAELRPVDRGAAEDDFLVIDFEGTIDGKPFDDGAGTDYGVELGEGRLAQDLERGLIGMKRRRRARHRIAAAAGSRGREHRGQGRQVPRDGEGRQGAGAARRSMTSWPPR